MENQWARVGTQVRARRKELRLTQDQVKQRGGPSTALQRQVESGTYSSEMHPAVRRGYEIALDWHMDTIDQLLAGREPSPVLDVRWPTDGESVGADSQSDLEFEFLTRVREDLTDEEWETMKSEATPYIEMLVRDIKNRNRDR